MAVPGLSEEVASRFAPYVRELHELFSMHGVGYGHETDLAGFNARLERPGPFAEDVSSILRSIILREGGSLPHGNLLEIVALAVTGAEVNPASAETQPQLRKLLSFVGAVVRRPWNVPPGDGPVEASKGAEAGTKGAEADAVAAAGSSASTLRVVEGAPSAEASERADVAGDAKAGGAKVLERPAIRFSAGGQMGQERVGDGRAGVDQDRNNHRAQGRERDSSRERELDQAQDGAQDQEHEHDHELVPPLPPVLRWFPSSAPLWIGAVCAIGLVIGVVFYSHTSLAGSNARAAEAESVTLPEPVLPAPVPEVKPAPEEEVAKPEVKPAPVVPAPKPQIAAARPAPAPRPPAVKPSAAVKPNAGGEPSPDAMVAASGDADEVADAGADGSALGGPLAALRSPIGKAAGRGGKDGPYFLVSSGIMASHLLEAPEPAYPTLARMTHIQGQVILQAVISTEGHVIATRVLSGHRLLRGAATSAVKRWVYKPYVMEGHPVNVATIITVDFHSHE